MMLLLAYLSILLGAIAGWIMNLIAIVHTVGDTITGLFIARLVGCFLLPLGAVLGWFV